MATRPPSAITSGCWASAGPPLALLGLLGSQGWHLAGHRRWEHQWGCEVAPSLGTQLLAVPTKHVLTKSCLGMTAMLTLRRADPCNRGAGVSTVRLLLSSSFSRPPQHLPTPQDTASSCWEGKLESQGSSKRRGLCLSLLLQAVLVGLPNPLPYLLSYRGSVSHSSWC